MALSDDEQRALEHIEQALTEDDPTFAAMVNNGWSRRRGLIGRAVGFVLGAVLLVSGLVTTHAQLLTGVLIALAGTAIMITTATLLLHHPTSHRPGPPP